MSGPLKVKAYVAPAGHNSRIEVEGLGELQHVVGFELMVEVGKPSILDVRFVDVEAEIIGEINPADQPAWLKEMRIAKAVHDGLTAAATDEGAGS